MSDKEEIHTNIKLPALLLKGLVLFPKMILTFDVGRAKSIEAINLAMQNDQKVFIVSQKDMIEENPSMDNIYHMGVVAKIKNILHQTGKNVKVTVEGLYRANINGFVQETPYIMVDVKKSEDYYYNDIIESIALINIVKEIFAQYIKLSNDIPPDLIVDIESQNDPAILSDIISANFISDIEQRQSLIEELDVNKRIENLIMLLLRNLDIAYVEKDLLIKFQNNIDKNQREYYLREQMNLILQELGEGEDLKSEANKFKEKIKDLKLDVDIENKLLKESEKLFKMPLESQEANVLRNYLDLCVNLPWNVSTQDKIDLVKAEAILNKDHYGLEKVKSRIIEMLAVKKLDSKIRGQIICLVGPPGVGKTSIAKSIAKAMGRKYVRVALGGVKDEATIRGHRRTYVGAMPGRIIDAIKQSGVNNPLVLLDEVDKLGKDVFGDPTSALLEVLDSEQNSHFQDHYIDIPFDLSNVLFITTANEYDEIPSAVLDRMDIIKIEGYTAEEKFNIAKKHLVVKNMKEHGLTSKTVKITDQSIRGLIEYYTREAGVRKLEQQICSLLRKAAKSLVLNEKSKVTIDIKNLEPMLGPKKFKKDRLDLKDEIGIAKGLAWTAVGGETMPIEVAVMKGNGKVQLTGSLGDVMKESAQTAISCVRTRAQKLGLDNNFYKKCDIHVHVPDGAVPKDGPSAGITLATSIVSALTHIPVKHDVAMTGEITLRGRVLPIGGLKEKTMAAYTLGVKNVILPRANEPDLADVDPVVKENINFIFADNLDTVIENALTRIPVEKVPLEIIKNDQSIQVEN